MTPAQVELVVAEARTWLRTPYVHRAAVKGEGVDCGMLIIEVFGNALGIPKPDVGNYSSDWYLHQDEPVYLNWLSKYADRIEEGQRGDIAMFNFGRHAAHGGIVVGDGLMIHAYRQNGNVELCEISSLATRDKGRGSLDSYWSIR